MKTNAIWGIIVAIIIIGGAVYLFGQDNQDNTALENAPIVDETPNENINQEMEEPVVVIYTESGFEPSPVTINQGQTVQWVNNSSREMWPASAFHPTHAGYPEKTENDCSGSAFDACMGIGAGETWEFTFNEAGTWRYHDHLNASRTGTVEVR
ncbi:MAG: hypothetical protein COX06_02655 [Candidatus Zambryskibacteria bacterium CG22_combo_CG10-13_8_21_14_all_42_17]|uniref:Blue (type 1) copper domain-containing protein n=1 Tax=Candidatus Zambryskibacteria bacterium CG22_combo_CG10-13_8_21_14_all_42_17 TaxID=1975118 RepID=A0A2H0BD50_9BACT|nr:MAG: hypothetical protein COX06_02655 [Candidatus Zambryskibacteria bacterium CG22_combo_CG10-13_8_21_14_all_42_17]